VPIRRDKPTALCTLDPARAVRAMADSLGRDARRELVELIVAAWVDAVPESELEGHFAKAIAGLAPEDLREIAGWPGTSGVAVALANREFLLDRRLRARRRRIRCGRQRDPVARQRVAVLVECATRRARTRVA
jgi:hypothetical protein